MRRLLKKWQIKNNEVDEIAINLLESINGTDLAVSLDIVYHCFVSMDSIPFDRGNIGGNVFFIGNDKSL